mmetsp:Transcript_15137/g.36150  ORF Transcript_15137/g.36150 Transcript_15137/m.36150 type:complete len:200 (-) Transcript_15137:45-644(-)
MYTVCSSCNKFTRRMRRRIVISSVTSSKPREKEGASSSGLYARNVAASAWLARSSPAPILEISASSPVVSDLISRKAEFIRNAFNATGLHSGHACFTKAAAPATTGAAPDVPPKIDSPSPVPNSATRFPPGAANSGLIRLKLISGPRAEEPMVVRAVGWKSLMSMVTVVLLLPWTKFSIMDVRMNSPSFKETIKAGIVG